MRGSLVAVLVVGAMVGTGCASSSGNVTASVKAALAPPETTPPTTASASTPVPPCDPAKSSRFVGNMPVAGDMPAGSYMRTIQARGRLIVGVDQNTLFFGYRDAETGDLDGFDIALAREVARAIFGNPDAVELRAVTTDQRLPVVESGDVDLVASQITATCTRRAEVDLSTIYYLAHQKVLVRTGGPITKVADLAGRKVCATTGSTSLDHITHVVPGAVPYPVAARTDCLVALEEGTVDAITSDDTILLGFEVQDPINTEILPQELSNEPYALATSKHHPEFGRFVNGVLDELRANGRLEQLYHQYLTHAGFVLPSAPPPAAYAD
ncbi:MAG TPA: glutamate ABC transporter substrate-binding protein [Acidimicrobiales bacterium]|nr:glutamate ABC transporter substrate-binding protein [Acidimicrobiales bacterium]